MPANDHPLHIDVSTLMELTREAMDLRWREGLVTPMSATINTFAKTDGSWWVGGQASWTRVPQGQQNEQLEFHHERFGKVDQARGPAAGGAWGRVAS